MSTQESRHTENADWAPTAQWLTFRQKWAMAYLAEVPEALLGPAGRQLRLSCLDSHTEGAPVGAEEGQQSRGDAAFQTSLFFAVEKSSSAKGSR